MPIFVKKVDAMHKSAGFLHSNEGAGVRPGRTSYSPTRNCAICLRALSL